LTKIPAAIMLGLQHEPISAGNNMAEGV